MMGVSLCEANQGTQRARLLSVGAGPIGLVANSCVPGRSVQRQAGGYDSSQAQPGLDG